MINSNFYNMKKKYPKILILFNGFYKKNGRDLTLEALFSDWPKENLLFLDIRSNEDKNYKAIKVNFFKIYLGKFYKKEIKFHNSEIANVEFIQKEKRKENSKKINKLKSFFIYKFIKDTLSITPFFEITKIDNNKLEIIEKFSPDVIFSIPFNIWHIKFIIKLKKILRKPLAIYFVDDWISLHNTIFVKYNIKKLISVADLLMAISGSLAKKYSDLYKKKFYNFNKPVNLDLWKNKKENYKINTKKCSILYFGNIQLYNIEEISDLDKAINILKNDNIIISFDIFGYFNNKNLLTKFNSFQNVNYHGRVSIEEISNIVTKYDFLFLPLSFKKEYIITMKTAMPTKFAEYLSTGVPIILYAPSYTELVSFSKKEGSAIIIDKKDINLLVKTLRNAILNEELRQMIGKKAINAAQKYFSSAVVKEKFRNLLSNLAIKNEAE